jgi:hypothetical protein
VRGAREQVRRRRRRRRREDEGVDVRGNHKSVELILVLRDCGFCTTVERAHSNAVPSYFLIITGPYAR